jgi:ketosteroid isomerase-like protein
VTQSAIAHTTDRDAALRRLLDESEIRAVLARYGRAIDRRDMDTVRTCYHPDATDAHGHYNGDVEGFIQNSIARWTEKSVSMTHIFGQSLIELDGDRAWVESYALCYIRYRPDQEGGKPTERLGNIRYVDLFERRDGEWRIAQRKVVHQPGRLDSVEIDPQLAEKAFRARADFDDPSYDRRPESFLP